MHEIASVHSQNCTACRAGFQIAPEDVSFYKRVSLEYPGLRLEVPPPTHCPRCRLRRRLSFRNEFSYFQRACDCCKKRIVSIHRPEAPYPVYCYRCWWADSWDSLDYGMAYDPQQPFLKQYATLASKVPQLAMVNDNGVTSENCEYCNDISSCKDCYLLSAAWFSQDVAYSNQVNHSNDSYDSTVCNHLQFSLECINSQKLHSCAYLIRSFECANCLFGLELRGCQHCLGCIGLRQARHCILNQQYSPAEYQAQLVALRLDTAQGLRAFAAHFENLREQAPVQATHQTNCEQSLGDALFNCKNATAFGFSKARDSKFLWQGDGATDCYDLHMTGAPELCYESGTPDNSYQALFTAFCWKSKYILYSEHCHSAEHLFGCVGLKRKQYCILNRQYSAAEYVALLAQIFDSMRADRSWGEYFPMQQSPFAYNDSRAQDLFPQSAEECRAEGLVYREETAPKSNASASATLSESVTQAKPELCQQTFCCEACARPYKILPKEFALYQLLGIALPGSCPRCRRTARFARFPSSGTLYQRACDACKQEAHSIFPSGAAQRVYCSSCFERHVYC